MGTLIIVLYEVMANIFGVGVDAQLRRSGVPSVNVWRIPRMAEGVRSMTRDVSSSEWNLRTLCATLSLNGGRKKGPTFKGWRG